MQYPIFVLEELRLGTSPKPLQTIQIDDVFICPHCQQNVPITYYEDSRGMHPNIGLQCPGCSRRYGILL